MSTIIARNAEIERLERVFHSKKAEFLAIYGRRRIGKTYLIREYFKDKGLYFEITGTQNASMSEQLKKYQREFTKLFPEQIERPVIKDWDEALSRLVSEVERITTQQKVIIFLDELPWLATPRSGLLKEIDYYWNRHFSQISNVIFIICGSAAAWMIKNIVRNRDGLYGRLSEIIHLQPFNLNQIEEYLRYKNIILDRKQIIALYMVMGGVAKYYDFIPRGMSATQIIDKLFFSSNGALLTEFVDLYLSLFNHAENHIKVVKALANKRYGMLRSELIKKMNMSSGGNLSAIIEELEASSFILTFKKFGQKNKQKCIRLLDEYSYFYLEFVDAIKADILHGFDQQSWQKIQSTARWRAWSGYAFENICLKHIGNIKQALGLRGVSTTQSQWRYVSDNAKDKGTEIDLLIDRADNCINICEIKFTDGEYVITKDYAHTLEQKRQIFKQKTNTKKTIFITMITPFGIKKNNHSLNIVDNEVKLDDLF